MNLELVKMCFKPHVTYVQNSVQQVKRVQQFNCIGRT